MAGKSDYLENANLNWLRGTAFPAAPSTLYVGLYSAAPTDAAGGTEFAGNAYARVAGVFGAPSGDQISNSAQVVFPIATPAGQGTAVANFTITYTNRAGTAGRSTGAVPLIAATRDRVAHNQLWFPLQSGDDGVRSVQSYVSSLTLTSTQMNIVVARRLAELPVIVANCAVAVDYVQQLPRLPRIYNNSALALLLQANVVTSPFQAWLEMVGE